VYFAKPATPAPIVAPVVKTESPFGPGSYALIVYETADRLTPKQTEILTDPNIRQYLKGQHVTFRILDDDAVMDNDPAFRKAMQSPRDTLPWLIVSRDGVWLSMPLPKDATATLNVLSKHFGVSQCVNGSCPQRNTGLVYSPAPSHVFPKPVPRPSRPKLLLR
jgi:hypothetical protein